jgi:hypothetical protein
MPFAAECEPEHVGRALAAVRNRKLICLGAFAAQADGECCGCRGGREDALEASG